jgi:hypothetical protein
MGIWNNPRVDKKILRNNCFFIKVFKKSFDRLTKIMLESLMKVFE